MTLSAVTTTELDVRRRYLGDGNRPDADALVTLLVWLDMDTDIARVVEPKGNAG
jgi:hypothetical protein